MSELHKVNTPMDDLLDQAKQLYRLANPDIAEPARKADLKTFSELCKQIKDEADRMAFEAHEDGFGGGFSEGWTEGYSEGGCT